MLSLKKYYDKIYIEDANIYDLIEIQFTGTFIGNVLVNDLTVFMGKNVIYITDIDYDFRDDIFMRYYGNFKIKKMYGYRKEGDDAIKEFGATREYSDEFKKFSSKYSEINATWNSLNETNKYKKDIESLLSYEKNGKVNYLCKTGKRGAVIKNIHGREMKILKKMQEGVR